MPLLPTGTGKATASTLTMKRNIARIVAEAQASLKAFDGPKPEGVGPPVIEGEDGFVCNMDDPDAAEKIFAHLMRVR